jgi:hypothetical protein
MSVREEVGSRTGSRDTFRENLRELSEIMTLKYIAFNPKISVSWQFPLCGIRMAAYQAVDPSLILGHRS